MNDFGKGALNKLEKLKEKIVQAPDFITLQKSMPRLNNCREEVNAVQHRNGKKQLMTLLGCCENLFKQKMKYFKKKAMSKGSINRSQQIDESECNKNIERTPMQQSNAFTKTRTLKHCRSTDGFGNANIKIIPRCDQHQQCFFKQNHPYHSELSSFDVYSKPSQLSPTNIEVCSNNNEYIKKTNTIMLDKALHLQQIKQQNNEIHDLKSKLKHFQESNSDLKTRYLNQQRRQQNYINGLLDRIKWQQEQIHKISIQNKKISQQLQNAVKKCKQTEQYIDTLQRQLKQLLQQKNKINDDEDLRKQLENISMHQKYINQMELQFQKQILKTNQLQKNNALLKKHNEELTLDLKQMKLIIITRQQKSDSILNNRFFLQQQLLKNNTLIKKLEESIHQKNFIISEFQKQKHDKQLESKLLNKFKIEKLKNIKNMMKQIYS